MLHTQQQPGNDANYFSREAKSFSVDEQYEK